MIENTELRHRIELKNWFNCSKIANNNSNHETKHGGTAIRLGLVRYIIFHMLVDPKCPKYVA